MSANGSLLEKTSLTSLASTSSYCVLLFQSSSSSDKGLNRDRQNERKSWLSLKHRRTHPHCIESDPRHRCGYRSRRQNSALMSFVLSKATFQWCDIAYLHTQLISGMVTYMNVIKIYVNLHWRSSTSTQSLFKSQCSLLTLLIGKNRQWGCCVWRSLKTTPKEGCYQTSVFAEASICLYCIQLFQMQSGKVTLRLWHREHIAQRVWGLIP